MAKRPTEPDSPLQYTPKGYISPRQDNWLGLGRDEADAQKRGPVREHTVVPGGFQGPAHPGDQAGLMHRGHFHKQLTFDPTPDTPGMDRRQWDEWGQMWYWVRFDIPGTDDNQWGRIRLFTNLENPRMPTDGDGDSYIHSPTDDEIDIVIGDGGGTFVFVADDFIMPATGRIYLDGSSSGNTYLTESSADTVQLVAGGDVYQFNTTGLYVPATNRIYLDGGGNTYIAESSADNLVFLVGGDTYRLTASAFTFPSDNSLVLQGTSGDIQIAATAQVFLDGGNNTYIQESSADVISLVCGGTVYDFSSTDLDLPASGNITVNGTDPVASVLVNAHQMWPRTTNGCAGEVTYETSTNKQTLYLLDFDSVSQEYAQFAIPFPDGWDGGTITARFYWFGMALLAGNVRWGIQCRAYADLDNFDQSWGTAVEVTDTRQTASISITSVTSAMTPAGSPSGGQWLQFQLYRDPTHGDDGYLADARLAGVLLEFYRSAFSD